MPWNGILTGPTYNIYCLCRGLTLNSIVFPSAVRRYFLMLLLWWSSVQTHCSLRPSIDGIISIPYTEPFYCSHDFHCSDLVPKRRQQSGTAWAGATGLVSVSGDYRVLTSLRCSRLWRWWWPQLQLFFPLAGDQGIQRRLSGLSRSTLPCCCLLNSKVCSFG